MTHQNLCLGKCWKLFRATFKVLLTQHYCIILAASLEKIYSCILGRVATIRLIIFNIKPYFAKRIAMMFCFCFFFWWIVSVKKSLFQGGNPPKKPLSPTSFPGSLFSASLGRWKKDPGCGWSCDHPSIQNRRLGGYSSKFG